MIYVINFLEKQSLLFHIILNLALLSILGVVDYLTDPDFLFSILYLIPVALGAWFLSRTTGIIAAFMIAAIWPVAEAVSGQLIENPIVSLWNGVIRLSLFISVALLLSALRNAYEYQKELARTDHLTSLANTRAFHELTQKEIIRANRYEHPFTLAFADIDNFKTVNDKYGHAVGDQLLKAVGDVVRRNLRASDTVARLGGDEFGILLPETDKEAARAVVKKVRDALMREMKLNGWFVTFSIGVVTCVEPPKTVAEVVKYSDDLVYAAKNSGKNTIRHEVVTAN